MIPTSVRIFVCTERQDMRRSFDTLALTVKERLELDPQSGALFVFANKRGNRLKVLWFDHNGYCILYKRVGLTRFLEGGRLPIHNDVRPHSSLGGLSPREFRKKFEQSRSTTREASL